MGKRRLFFLFFGPNRGIIVGNSVSIHARILVVDDNKGARESLEEILEDDFDVECVEDGPNALDRISNDEFDIVLLDLVMPKMDGIETLKRIKAYDQSIDVIMISATNRAQEATDSIKSGAYDYLTKPFDTKVIFNIIERVMQKRSLEQEVRYLRSEVENKSGYNQMISQSRSMKAVFALIEKVALTSSSVLITGESGTGKELVSRAIHNKSTRVKKPFVAINCAAIPPELIESELFGHEKGAFTGAYNRGVGKFEFADGGTVFLDEISNLKIELQAKLLRFLQEHEFTRVGSHRTIKVDVRMIAATNIQLKKMVRQNRFREDLYYRLNVIPIQLPPLRSRKGDIPILTTYFIEKFNHRLNEKILGITPAAMTVLRDYHWPGNIRELENLIERLIVLKSDGLFIDEKDLPFDLLLGDDFLKDKKNLDKGLLEARLTFERQYILRALQALSWNKIKTARKLGIHRNTLMQKIKALDINIGAGK
ncbi:MAG: sigma-54-dependent Fis family transcriptional regulator [Deltaproteobacteria bacterium]|nr:sigma-54-dependent Fis family transcriptional regulator [Deltaproteobacteria bacterium]